MLITSISLPLTGSNSQESINELAMAPASEIVRVPSHPSSPLPEKATHQMPVASWKRKGVLPLTVSYSHESTTLLVIAPEVEISIVLIHPWSPLPE
jgi:hypothetical protein